MRDRRHVLVEQRHDGSIDHIRRETTRARPQNITGTVGATVVGRAARKRAALVDTPRLNEHEASLEQTVLTDPQVHRIQQQ